MNPALCRENPLVFYPRRAWEILSTYVTGVSYYLSLQRMRRKILRDPQSVHYTDAALNLTPPGDEPADPAQAAAAPGGCNSPGCDSPEGCDSHGHAHDGPVLLQIAPAPPAAGERRSA